MERLIRFALLGTVFLAVSQGGLAATWTPQVPLPNVNQCFPISVNDSAISVGNCSSNSGSKNRVPWVASAAGIQVAFSVLATGQPCNVWGVSNNARAVGSCKDSMGGSFGVTWDGNNPASAPTKLSALPGTLVFPLLRPADVATQGTAINRQGDVVGLSFNSDGVGTAVFYSAGSSVPRRISSWGDNCQAVDINLPATGNPTVAMNCPGSEGSATASYAQLSGSSFTFGELSLPAGATNCVVVRVDDASRFTGTCYFNDSEINVTKSAFWSSATAAPQLLTLSAGSANSALALNNSGVVLVAQQTDDGSSYYLLWVPSPLPLPAIQAVIPPVGVKWFKAFALGSNNRVAFIYLDTHQVAQSCTWTGSAGASCVTWTNPADNNRLTAMSENGINVVGAVLQDDQSVIAVKAVVP